MQHAPLVQNEGIVLLGDAAEPLQNAGLAHGSGLQEKFGGQQVTGGYDGFGLGGKRVLVTGGSIGIGAAAVKAFAEAGAKVAIHYNKNREKAEALAAEIGGAPTFGGDFSKRRK